MNAGLYLHHLGYAPGHPQWRMAWTRLQVGVGVICAAASASGVTLTVGGHDGQVHIHFDDRAVLVLHGPQTAGPEGMWTVETVRTDRAACDPWLCAVILRAHLLAPACTAVASDGLWDREWADGIGFEVSDAAPRRIVARLFGNRTLAADQPDPLVTAEQACTGPGTLR